MNAPNDWRARRAAREKEAAESNTRALAVAQRVEQFLGTTSDQKEATERLAKLAKECHLLSPARTCPRLPEGTGVAFSMVLVNVEHETYDQQGKKALLKPALEKIAMAAGIRWDMALCGLIDDRKRENYYLYRAVGSFRLLDNTEIQLSAHKELDLRDGSPTVEALRETCVAKAMKEREKNKLSEADARKDGLEHAVNQLRTLRLHALRTVESKAFNAVIRRIGLRQAYAVDELAIPFVVARLQWTGATNDPTLRREFAHRTADAFLGARQGAYGTARDAPTVIDVTPSAPDAPPPPAGPAPAPRTRWEDGEVPPEDGQEPDAAPETPPGQPETGQEAARAAPDAPTGQATPDAAQGATERPRRPTADPKPPMDWKGKPFTISAGKGGPQVPIEEVLDPDQVRYWIDRLTADLDAGKIEDKFLNYNLAKLAALEWHLANALPW